MATSAADVPARFDLVLSGGGLAGPVGFVFLDALEPSLPFRTHRAIYSYTPTFIERSNVSGNFGDNQQDFFLTSSQRDWSEGEQQRFYRASDQDSARRYWTGASVDPLSTVGQVSLREPVTSLTFAAASASAWPHPSSNLVCVLTSTNLYTVDNAGTIVDKGAHGLGHTPQVDSITSDGVKLYFSYFDAAGTGTIVRTFTGSTFASFATGSGATALAFLNNTLYGWRSGSDDLVRYDTAGVLTSIFPWKNADGTIGTANAVVLRPFGGKLLILRSWSNGTNELWIYDGSGTSLVAQLPRGFKASTLEIAYGTAFIGGLVNNKPTILYWANGTLGQLWQSTSTSTREPSLSNFRSGLLFTDPGNGKLMLYDSNLGGVHTVGTYTDAGSAPRLVSTSNSSSSFALLQQAATTGYYFLGSGKVSSATVTTSLFDFDSSLTKSMRAITVEFDSATDGNGGTVDVSYRTGDVDGSYTSLATGITSGAENLISGVSGKSISIKVTLNKGTSTNGPVLKRISVRAAPILTAFRMGEYVLDCTGDGGKSPRTLRDGTPNPLSGSESMAQLEIAKASTTPLTITDRRSGYSGFIETLEAYEEHPGIDDPTRSGEFVVKLITRGV